MWLPILIAIIQQAASVGNPTVTGGVGNQCATPVLHPSTGVSTTSVTITDGTAGATIFYTISTAGVDPTHSGATPTSGTLVYSGAFVPGANKTVRALAYLSGLSDSAIASGDYGSSL